MSSFQVIYTPRDKLIDAAKANGWTEDDAGGLLDAVGDHFSFTEIDSEYRTLEDAIVRAKALVVNERDFFGEVTIDELERRLLVPEDNYFDWVTVARHHVDETGLTETVRCEDGE